MWQVSVFNVKKIGEERDLRRLLKWEGIEHVNGQDKGRAQMLVLLGKE